MPLSGSSSLQEPKPQGKFYSPVGMIEMPVAMMERLLSGFPLKRYQDVIAKQRGPSSRLPTPIGALET